MYYYGGATVTYQDMKLTADYIEYDMKTNTPGGKQSWDLRGPIRGESG